MSDSNPGAAIIAVMVAVMEPEQRERAAARLRALAADSPEAGQEANDMLLGTADVLEALRDQPTQGWR